MTEGITFNEIKVTVFQSPACECCKKYTAYLKEQGFQVKVTYLEDGGTALRKKYLVPPEMRSCHLAVIEDYFVEGHVPVAAIEKLLAEKPAIDGISLPGMLPGSPGMPGQQKEAFIIYALSNGTTSEFMITNE